MLAAEPTAPVCNALAAAALTQPAAAAAVAAAAPRVI